jgi:16S rRNA (cytosine967-C5)-methyltransferase
MSAAPAVNPVVNTPAAWPAAAALVARWLDRRERVDALLDSLPRTLAGTQRARCQHLVLGVVRHYGRIDAALSRLVSHPPRFSTRAVLFIAGFELIDAADDQDEGRVAKIVHHAVEQTKSLASPAEARLVNAVVRKLAAAMASPAPAMNISAEELGEYFSHPAWLVRSWLAQFGPEKTRFLLEWNQKPAPVHARWRAADANVVPPPFLKPTVWKNILAVESGHWSEIEPLLKSGQLYLQDPSTLTPIDLLAPQPGENVIDLCAAPGGKSLLIVDTMKSCSPAEAPAKMGVTAEDAAKVGVSTEGTGKLRVSTEGSAKVGRLVAVDQPGDRIDRLKENLSRTSGVDVALVQADVLSNLATSLREHRLPEVYDAVLLDVPCSNTGVMRHRVDVKWRLQPGDFKKHPQQQLSFLHAAARLVAPGGRLVYSTCSIDAEENEHVVRAFLASKAGGPYTLERSVLHYPWTAGHDGAAAFLLRRTTR